MSRLDLLKERKIPQSTVPDVNVVLDLLESQWHQEVEPAVESLGDPLDGLILTVLSQNTNDRNRDMAYERLRSRHGDWAAIAALSHGEVADAIRSAGISNIKAATILRVLENVKARTGSYSLSPLREESRDAVWNFLTGLQGVGPKTAAVVMVFDLGIPAFPVDTHVARFCRRMAWVDVKAQPAVIQEDMEHRVPDHRKAGAHLNIITHGRQICKARKPICSDCVLRGFCPSSLN